MLSLGLDGWGYLHAPSNRTEELVRGHLIERVSELREVAMRQLAVQIVNTYGEALK